MSTCQGQHRDGSPCRNPAPEVQTRCYIHSRSEPAAPLTGQDVLAAIEEHGGPERLDLSQENLAGVDLGRVSIQYELSRRAPGRPPWHSEDTQGANLLSANFHGANLGKANLQGAKLLLADLQGANLLAADLRGANLAMANVQGADLSATNLQEAILWEASLQKALFKNADLRGANLSASNLQGAYLWSADLQGANLWDADLQGANLWEANLHGADLRMAKLQGVDLLSAVDLIGIRWCGVVLERTRLRRWQLGPKIGDELAAEKGEGSASYDEAREAYLALKNNFNEMGRYDDASWAYRRERRMERAMSWPGRVAKEFEEQKRRLEKAHPRLGRPWFHVRHTGKWLADSLVQWLTGYGEDPRPVLGWAALLVFVVYPVVYWWCAGRQAPAGGLPALVADYILLSVELFSTLGPIGRDPLDAWTKVWAGSESMVGLSFLALLMFTLGNRASRS